MKLLCALPLLLAVIRPAHADDSPAPVKGLAITRVTVIDAAGGPAKADMTVIVLGDRIEAMGSAKELMPTPDVRVVDGRGKFLIPGLWDMHVHMAGKAYLPLFLANGVTGIREMHAFYPEMIFQMRKDIREGKLLGPQIVAAGALVDGPNPFWPGSLVAGTAEEGRKAVRSLKKRGADFIKVYTKLPREAYLAIADEAKEVGLPFAGHVPESVSAAEASELGQKSMEHLYGIVLACSRDEEKLRKEEVEALLKADPVESRVLLRRTQAKALDSFDAERAEALFRRFAKNGTWQVPTLTVLRSLASLDDEKFTRDPRMKYVPKFIRAGWDPNKGYLKMPADALAGMKRNYKKAGELVRGLHRAGVPFLAGTDVTNPYTFAGFSLHDELRLLVEAGFTPMEALQTATINPARFLGMEKTLGTVEKGKRADLVLLDADPTADIGNTRKIAAVVVGGKLLAREELTRMLAEVEKANGP